ncbi:hypothetical protein [Luteibacter yeojuensis]|uniref:Uncharacterized protein n=1 Tax=Luteibacter yeojuensis TaxID=345309 RepID=A0A7X5QXV9_9GAMM|nr:hypothetical protein [Luteibacter yeojuensis]NID17411.1 hypothetical protein [Luteibacter yeojuensis]
MSYRILFRLAALVAATCVASTFDDVKAAAAPAHRRRRGDRRTAGLSRHG